MTVIERVNSLIADAINKNDEFYEALWGKTEFTPEMTIEDPNDYNCGAIANQLEYLCSWIGLLTEKDLIDMRDYQLEMIALFFSLETRLGPDELNGDFIDRIYSYTYKKGQSPWGTPWSILKSLSYYVPEENLYYIPNAVETNLITNGSFENPIGSEWTFSPSGDRSLSGAFVGSYKVNLTMSSLSQTVSLPSGSYAFHLYAKGSPGSLFNVTFQRSSDNYYFNSSNLTWNSSIQYNNFTSTEDVYQLCELFLVVDGSYDVDINILRVNDCFIDRVELGLIQYPSFAILYQDLGTASGYASVWGTISTNYTLASYIDQDFMFESAVSAYAQTFLQSVLDKLRPSGVKGIFLLERKEG